MLPGPRELQLALFMTKAHDEDDSRNFHMTEVGQWLAHDTSLMFPDISGNAVKKLYIAYYLKFDFSIR